VQHFRRRAAEVWRVGGDLGVYGQGRQGRAYTREEEEARVYPSSSRASRASRASLLLLPSCPGPRLPSFRRTAAEAGNAPRPLAGMVYPGHGRVGIYHGACTVVYAPWCTHHGPYTRHNVA